MLIAGVDEVGRGTLAGPVVAAAVIMTKKFDSKNINDSKKISAKTRLELSNYIKKISRQTFYLQLCTFLCYVYDEFIIFYLAF